MNSVRRNPFFIYKVSDICMVCLKLHKNKRTSDVRDKLPVTNAPEFYKLLESISLFKYTKESDQKLCSTCCYKLLNVYELQQMCNIAFSHFDDYIRHTYADDACKLDIGTTTVNFPPSNDEDIQDVTPSTSEMHNKTTENELVTTDNSFFREQNMPNLQTQHLQTYRRETEIEAIELDSTTFINAPQAKNQYLGAPLIYNDTNRESSDIPTVRTKVAEITDKSTRALPVTELKTETMEIDNNLHPIDSGPDPLDLGEKANSREMEVSSRNERSSSNQTGKEQEIMRKGADDRYTCRLCNVICSVEHVDVHLAWHEQLKGSCGTCNISFSTLTELKNHIELSNLACKQSETDARKLFQCEYCSRFFVEERFYRTHVKGAVPTCRKYICMHCGKVCQSKQSLTIHERLHTSEKAYSCEHCGQDFARQSNLIRHKFVHTDRLRYSCDKCGEMFALLRHYRGHYTKMH